MDFSFFADVDDPDSPSLAVSGNPIDKLEELKPHFTPKLVLPYYTYSGSPTHPPWCAYHAALHCTLIEVVVLALKAFAG